MHFCLLFDGDAVANARQKFPLFFDFCLPDPIDGEDGSRYALVCDAEHSALAVLRHSPPYRESAVSIVSLVVTNLGGLHRLLQFLRQFLRLCADLPLSGITVSKDLVLSLHGDVSHMAVDAAFCEHLFQPSLR